jgi:hypothetical protein
MGYTALRRLVLQVAKEQFAKGPGWAQQRAVLEEVVDRIPGARTDDRVEQRILTCWHDLFRDGALSWGFNIDNPDAPFYHIPELDAERDASKEQTLRA